MSRPITLQEIEDQRTKEREKLKGMCVDYIQNKHEIDYMKNQAAKWDEVCAAIPDLINSYTWIYAGVLVGYLIFQFLLIEAVKYLLQ